MRVIYHKRPRGRKVKWSLSRTGMQRWHFLRVIMTNLFTHERIQTTHAKARHIRPTAERIVKTAKMFQETGNEFYFRRLERYLTTREAIEKLMREILPRLSDVNCNYIRVEKMDKWRKGDNTQMGFIEIIGNDIQIYEEQMKLSEYEEKGIPSPEEFERKLLSQEELLFVNKLDEVEEKINNILQEFEADELQKGEEAELKRLEQSKKFFKKQLDVVQNENNILDKSVVHGKFLTQIY